MTISAPNHGAGLTCHLLIALFTLVASLAGGESPAANNGRRIEDTTDWAAFLARHDLVWQQLPTNWSQAPHCGNAMLGSMLFQTGNAITLQIHRADVSDHRDNSHGWTAYSRPRFRIGDFRLMPVGKITGGAWRLDLWNAEVTGTIRTDRGEITFRHFVHADEMAIVTELHPSAGEAGCRWQWFPQRAETGRGDYPKTAADVDKFAKKYGDVYRTGLVVPAVPNPLGRQERDGAVSVWTQDLLAGGQYATAWNDGPRADGSRVLTVSIANSYPERTARDEAVRTVSAWNGRDLGPATTSHRDWWHRYYRQSFLSIPDTRLESLYWGSIYRLGSTARTGRAIVDCPGIWFQGGGWCYTTTDWNIQTALWPVYAANRLEVGGELMPMLHRGREALIANVRPAEWQSDSSYLAVAVNADLVGPRDQDMRYWNLLGTLPWTLHNCWWQYRYSMDDAMLREQLYPLLRRAVNLYLHLLRDEGGKLRLPPTISPESGTWQDCNFDLALLRWGCQTLLWSAQRLGIDDPLRPRWQDVLNRLVDFPADADGFRLGSDRTAMKDHRHGAHQMMIYPLHLVNIDQEDRRAVLKRSAEVFSATTGLPAMVATQASPLAASIGDGDLALSSLQRQQADLLPNGMWFPTPCLESSLSAANSIQMLLLQSWGDRIRVFPAMPTSWPEAVFNDLRTEGAFLVSARRSAGQTAWVRIKSLAGEPCRIQPGFSTAARIISGDSGISLREVGTGIYELDLKQGQEALLAPQGSAPRFLVEPLPAQADRINTFGLPTTHP